MRSLLAAFALLLAAPAVAQPGAAADTLDLFVVAGQSNARGAGGDADLAPLPEPGVAYWASVRGSRAGLVDAASRPPLNGSAWPAFAIRYHELTGRRVLLLQTAFGGTSNVPEADRGRGHWSARHDGPGARGGPNRLRIALRDLEGLMANLPAGVAVRAAGVLWIQGG